MNPTSRKTMCAGRLIVSDFDGTICSIPPALKSVYGSINALLARGEDYLDHAYVNHKVCDMFEGNEVIVVTGRTNPLLVWRYCRQHAIHITKVICAPAGVWDKKDGVDIMRARKKMTIERIDPDVVFDDDAKTLDMLDIRGEKVYVG